MIFRRLWSDTGHLLSGSSREMLASPWQQHRATACNVVYICTKYNLHYTCTLYMYIVVPHVSTCTNACYQMYMYMHAHVYMTCMVYSCFHIYTVRKNNPPLYLSCGSLGVWSSEQSTTSATSTTTRRSVGTCTLLFY